MLIIWLEPFFELSPPGQSTAHAPRPLLTPTTGKMPFLAKIVSKIARWQIKIVCYQVLGHCENGKMGPGSQRAA